MESEMRAELGRTPFSVVDVETTGFNAYGNDRIIEVGIVRLRPDLTIEDEFVTLINPERDIGSTQVHGISATDVTHAPTFRQAAGEIASRLQGAILASHNIRFDSTFVSAEFARLGSPMPEWPMVCTLALAHALLDEPPSRKLAFCCQEAGIEVGHQHHALDDARATALLLAHYVQHAARTGRTRLEYLGCACLDLPGKDWARWPRSGCAITRSQAADHTKADGQYLTRLVDTLAGDDASDTAQAEYMALLDRVLIDRRVSREEAQGLLHMAEVLGLSRAAVQEVHERYLRSLVHEAYADGIVSPAEHKDLACVAMMLGISDRALQIMLAEPRPPSELSTATLSGTLAGKSVCFTGEMQGTVNGRAISRELTEELASGAGLKVLPRVTKKLDILVVADANTASSKAKKAKEYGTTIMAAAAFWKAIGVQVV
jgi:DNA polymerase-3 subunit epsilon